MFNLPWYAWLNLLSLPILLVLLWMDYAVRDFGKWARELATFQVVCCAGTLLLYRNTHVFDPGLLLSYLLFITVGILFVVQVIELCSSLFLGARSKFKSARSKSAEPGVVVASGEKLDLDADYVDFDSVDCCGSKKVYDNLPSVLDGKLDNGVRFKSALKMMGAIKDDEDIYDVEGFLSSTLYYALFVFLIITPPFLQSVKLIRLY